MRNKFLNGRRTVFEDPSMPGRNGPMGLAHRFAMHSPLTLVVLMLGTNDFQSVHPHTACHAVQGIATLVKGIRQAPIEPGMPKGPVLVVVPAPIVIPKEPILATFPGAEATCVALAHAYLEVCPALDCAYYDAATVIASSRVDAIISRSISTRPSGKRSESSRDDHRHKLLGVETLCLSSFSISGSQRATSTTVTRPCCHPRAFV